MPSAPPSGLRRSVAQHSRRALRGDAWSLAILDELAHFIDTSDGPASAKRIHEAASPALAQFADQGWLISISRPGWRSEQFFRLVERPQGGDYPLMHLAAMTSAQMNPRLSAEWLAEQRHKDPDLYAPRVTCRVRGRGRVLGLGERARLRSAGIGALPAPRPGC